MPVIVNGKRGHLECACGVVSKTYAVTSPAAPDLSICEQAHEVEGWAYSMGFFAMMLGHVVMCPTCAAGLASVRGSTTRLIRKTKPGV